LHVRGVVGTSPAHALAVSNTSDVIKVRMRGAYQDRRAIEPAASRVASPRTTVELRNLIVADAAARTALYAEVDHEIKRSVPVVVNDPADAELRLKAYLTHKLK
jgi:hypothetical protein